METNEIVPLLKKHHHEFSDYIVNLSDADFIYSQNNQKWTAGQQLEHIIMSVTPLIKAFQLPNFMLQLMFGKANRSSKSYAELVAKYHSKLEQGGRAPSRFLPKMMAVEQKNSAQKKLLKLIDKLCKQFAGFSNEELNKYILPHPLLGKITLLEMFYFTLYHVQHHHKIIKENLASKK